MTGRRNLPDWRSLAASMSPERVDRILIASCAAIWLVVLGMGVAATAALVDLGRGHPGDGPDSRTSGLLYAVIVVSAAIIVAAIPLLVRARRAALAGSGGRSAGSPARRTVSQQSEPAGSVPLGTAVDPATEKLTVVGSAAASQDSELPDQPGRASGPAQLAQERIPKAIPEDLVDRTWLRSTFTLVGAMGVALVAVAVATQLMAVGNDGSAWGSYVVAGIITTAMPVIPFLHLRRLRSAASHIQPGE